MQRCKMASAVTTVTVLTCFLAVTVSPVMAQEYEIAGGDVAVFNLAGRVTIQGGSASAVTVRVERGGRDAGRLSVETGAIDGRETLRIIYPSDRIRYESQDRGETTLRVRSDGTFGEHREWRRSGGDRVTISHRRGNLEAHADLTILVPRGQRFAMYLGVGRLSVRNVDGDLRFDTSSGPIDITDATGTVEVDTGSGHVELRRVSGDLSVDTGSGSVIVSEVNGPSLTVDTGSGSVEASSVRVSSLNIDTGSGRIEARSVAASEIRLDTGSGSVVVELIEDADDLAIDTGSGSVTVVVPESFGAQVEMETSSGEIDFEMPVTVRRWQRDHITGTIGDGRGRFVIDTGSGSIRIRRAN